ncbi:hypothetical protein F2Q70_00033870 [Brassica cretica]|uniref:Uncharacterized protein n=1 Tax=Brassica cretica TaxID=69181 RepID=A0A8S9JUZ5_BRACR|nr:hypothetical protein F2Q70_00033870 [Brassica cretica]
MCSSIGMLKQVSPRAASVYSGESEDSQHMFALKDLQLGDDVVDRWLEISAVLYSLGDQLARYFELYKDRQPQSAAGNDKAYTSSTCRGNEEGNVVGRLPRQYLVENVNALAAGKQSIPHARAVGQYSSAEARKVHQVTDPLSHG